jgi:cytochrome c553
MLFAGLVFGAEQASTPSSSAAALDNKGHLDFEARVRPILVARCDECHGDTAEGSLRLDTREGLLRGGDTGPAIVVGDPEASLLIKAVRHSHPKLRMPKKRGKLPAEEIETLAKWIAEGALWTTSTNPPAVAKKIDIASQREFWSLRPLAQPPLPAVTNSAWPQSDLDRFVLARLEKEGLAPTAQADKRMLIRRANFDLTGLPPTAEEVAAFIADSSPDAFAKVVDRLLASPHYGEAWARWWLDVARYGENDCRSLDPMGRGYNPYPYAYLYRDWVAQALNDDLPYDQFVISQLAADLLGEKGRAGRLPALGFLGLGPWLYDNASVEVGRADERHDRVDVVSRGLLGLTIACARCHDHKYDAVSAQDYYALASIFKNTTYNEYPQVPQSVVDEYKKAEKRVEDKEKLLAEFLKNERRQLSESLAMQTSNYLMAAWSVQGEQKKDKAAVASKEKLDYELCDRWLAFLDKPPKHYGYLKKWQEMIAARGKKEEAQKLADEFQEVVLDVMFEHIDVEEENEIIRAKALPGTKKKKPARLPSDFVTNDDFCPGCGLELRTLKGERNSLWIDLFDRDLDYQAEFAQDTDSPKKPGVFAFDDFGIERQLGAERRRHIEELRADIKKLRKEIEPKYPYVHGVADVATPSPIRLHLRGSPFRLGTEVLPHFPALLCPDAPTAFTNGSGRLELARAIVAHPIASRTIVNRVWKWHFGTGLVETPGDLGITGETPSNPGLLEHLAWLFVNGGMSLKKFHREILLSATYQLSDGYSEHNAVVDSGNRLYWRANPRRLSAEQIRDAALSAAGTLDLKIGGPSEKLTPLSTRRTLYAQISRFKLDEYLALFDFPSPVSTAERRFTTQVPLQRLFLMNSDFMQQRAEALALRVANETNITARIQKLYSILFARPATDAEVAAGEAYLSAEPMKAYSERKVAKEKEELEAKGKPASAKPGKSRESKDEESDDNEDKKPEPGMMAGVSESGATLKPTPKALTVTIDGRYAKTLMSSHEFLFIR